MARKPMTEEEKKARAAKAAATRAANKEKALKDMGVTRTKPKRKRKAMSAEQKAAAVERLAKARAARQAGQPKYKSYHESIRELPDDDTFSVKNVLEWLKYQKELLQSMRGYKNSKDPKERKQYVETSVYVDNLNTYLRSGVYTSAFYGKEGTSRVKYICRAMAYYKDGTPKRSEGVWYPDIGTVWTRELEDG